MFQTFEDIDLFHLIGAICGLAIYNLTIVELNFPLVLYKKLLQRLPTLDDLKEMMPDVARCVPHPVSHSSFLSWIALYERQTEVLALKLWCPFSNS